MEGGKDGGREGGIRIPSHSVPQHVHSRTALQVCVWFDANEHGTVLKFSRKLIVVILNLVLTVPLQLWLHFIFAKTSSSWVIPGLEDLPFPEPPEWYQQLVCVCVCGTAHHTRRKRHAIGYSIPPPISSTII